MGGILEKVVTPTRTHYKHLIAAPGGVVAIYNRRSDATEETIYFTKDHLGSIDSITNQAGAVQVRLSYDTFGKRRNAAGWWGAVPGADLTAIANTSRLGYTGHEHLDNLGLIHMNGRVQDPFIGRFLSADPFVPEPFNGQSFNRYSYVRNNPLAFVDPSGFTDEPAVECVFCVYVNVSSVFAPPGIGGAGYGNGTLSFTGSPFMIGEPGTAPQGFASNGLQSDDGVCELIGPGISGQEADACASKRTKVQIIGLCEDGGGELCDLTDLGGSDTDIHFGKLGKAVGERWNFYWEEEFLGDATIAISVTTGVGGIRWVASRITRNHVKEAVFFYVRIFKDPGSRIPVPPQILPPPPPSIVQPHVPSQPLPPRVIPPGD
ncbi:MAG: RHS repeat-associated core domain-containing protein [Gammaproteobacteria bacterium]|nr:RHS repeat-associated core domain-containing protein [Gammaproteobacteria bacterium]